MNGSDRLLDLVGLESKWERAENVKKRCVLKSEIGQAKLRPETIVSFRSHPFPVIISTREYRHISNYVHHSLKMCD